MFISDRGDLKRRIGIAVKNAPQILERIRKERELREQKEEKH